MSRYSVLILLIHSWIPIHGCSTTGQTFIIIWLVVSTHLKNMKFPIYGKIKVMFQSPPTSHCLAMVVHSPVLLGERTTWVTPAVPIARWWVCHRPRRLGSIAILGQIVLWTCQITRCNISLFYMYANTYIYILYIYIYGIYIYIYIHIYTHIIFISFIHSFIYSSFYVYRQTV